MYCISIHPLATFACFTYTGEGEGQGEAWATSGAMDAWLMDKKEPLA